MVGRKPSGVFGAVNSSVALQIGQGAPAPPQLQARSPNHGLSGWFSQTQRQLSHRAHQFISQVLPQAFEERMPDFALGGFRAVFDLGQQLRLHPDALVRDALGVGLGLLRISGVRRLRKSAADVLSKPWSTLPA
jgi:hypothetical protein